MVIHKQIDNHPNYSISTKGEVYSYKNNKWGLREEPVKLKTQINKTTGYQCVRFEGKTYTIHRLVAQHFIPNPENKGDVNHINGIKTDNRMENLEWLTRSENIKHAFAIGLNSISEDHKEALRQARISEAKKVIDTVTGKIYDSISFAAKETGYSKTALRNYLTGKDGNRNVKNKTSLKFINK